MKPGAIADILKDMRVVVEPAGPDPVRAFAAHLADIFGVSVHDGRHEMAADTGQRLRPFGHTGRCVMRAAGTEMRCALAESRAVAACRRRGQACRPAAEISTVTVRIQALCHKWQQCVWCQFTSCRDQRMIVRPGLAGNQARGTASHPRGKCPDLFLDDTAFFFDNQNFGFAVHEGCRARLFNWPDQPDFVNIDTKPPAGVSVQPDQTQRLHQVTMRLANGDDPHARRRIAMNDTVDRVGNGERGGGSKLCLHPFFQMQAGGIWPAHMQAVGCGGQGGFLKIRQRCKIDRLTSLDQFGHGFEATPQA